MTRCNVGCVGGQDTTGWKIFRGIVVVVVAVAVVVVVVVRIRIVVCVLILNFVE